MGENYLTGVEYRDSTEKERLLQAALLKLTGKTWHITLKTDETTVLVESEARIEEIIRRETRIETGHLTMDDIYFQIVNSAGYNIFFPLVQFKTFTEFPRSLNFYFDQYWWMFRIILD